MTKFAKFTAPEMAKKRQFLHFYKVENFQINQIQKTKNDKNGSFGTSI